MRNPINVLSSYQKHSSDRSYTFERVYARNTTRLRKELGETQNPEEREQRIAQELRRMELERQTVPYFEPFDPNYRRLQYVRYADDFLIGVIGSKEDALEIKRKVREFTGSVLHLELSEEKTLITHSAKRARFLGYGSINASQWGWEISKEQADYLRAKYLFEPEEEPFLPTDSML